MRSSSTETPLSLSTPILATGRLQRPFLRSAKALVKSFSLKNRPLLWRILYAGCIRFKDHFSFPWLEPWGDLPWFFMRIWWNFWRQNTWCVAASLSLGPPKFLFSGSSILSVMFILCINLIRPLCPGVCVNISQLLLWSFFFRWD